jgi:serine/threonine protein kinase
VDVLLDLCDGNLNDWDKLSGKQRKSSVFTHFHFFMIYNSYRLQSYKLVEDLHRIGIVHEDLEPRNIVRTRGGGFHLIDFSESRRHICKESKV